MNKNALILSTIAAGALLAGHAQVAGARTFAPSAGTATVVSGNASCLANSWEGSTNSCSGEIWAEWPMVIDSSGNKNYTVWTSNQGNCYAYGLNNIGTSYWRSPNGTGVAGNTFPMYLTVYVPDGGYSYVSCSILGPGYAGGSTVIRSINLGNP